ncbi:MAG TPA: hypothetical protein VFT59_03530 [Candidatus Saccharimonadales bacterium]|nr:hypothetical protein [Candidatus Saccharimonadales bacterium]
MASRQEVTTWTTQQLYDLFIIGLSWVCDPNDVKTITRSGVGIFYTLRHAGVLSEAQRKHTAINSELVTLFQQHCTELYRTNLPISFAQAREILAASPYHIVTFMSPDELLNHSKFFGPNGYPLGITHAGRTYAESIAAQYAEVINYTSFEEGWGKYTRWLRSMHLVQGAE